MMRGSADGFDNGQQFIEAAPSQRMQPSRNEHARDIMGLNEIPDFPMSRHANASMPRHDLSLCMQQYYEPQNASSDARPLCWWQPWYNTYLQPPILLPILTTRTASMTSITLSLLTLFQQHRHWQGVLFTLITMVSPPCCVISGFFTVTNH